MIVWRLFKTAHCKVDDFRRGRTRQADHEFIAECDLPDDPQALWIALGVRRAVAGVGLVDPLFIRASDRFPEDLGVLPLLYSIDWLSFLLELEREIGKHGWPIDQLRQQNKFTVGQLVLQVYQCLSESNEGGETTELRSGAE